MVLVSSRLSFPVDGRQIALGSKCLLHDCHGRCRRKQPWSEPELVAVVGMGNECLVLVLSRFDDERSLDSGNWFVRILELAW